MSTDKVAEIKLECLKMAERLCPKPMDRTEVLKIAAELFAFFE